MVSRASSTLLLLPAPPSVSLGEVKASFEQPLSEVLFKLAQSVKGTEKIATVDIVLAIPGLQSPSNKPQAKIFPQLQRYLASIYTLIAAIATAKEIELDTPGGVDARVVFLDQPASAQKASPSAGSHQKTGPILDIQSISTSGRQWDHVFYVGNLAGQVLANSFLQNLPESLRDRFVSRTKAIPGAGDWSVPGSLLIPNDQLSPVPHYSVAVGGTFDHLHLGHKLLLTATALALEPADQTNQSQDRFLTIGVTGDEMLKKKKFAECLESWEERYQSTAAFLSAIMDFSGDSNVQVTRSRTANGKGQVVVLQVRPHLRFKFEEFFDVCGPTVTDQDITGLVLSKETQAGGAIVNTERAKKGWHTLAVFEVDVLNSEGAPDANSFESKLSSTDIRRRRLQAKV